MAERKIDPQLLELEIEMHAGFTPWIASQSERHSGKILDISYNPQKHESQRIDVALTPSVVRSERLQPAEALIEMDDQFAQFMRGYDKARFYIKTFLEAKAFDDSDQGLVDTVADYIDDGKSIGLLTDHAEDLFDIAKGQAALSLAIARSRGPDYMTSFKAWINKLMSREEIRKRGYIPDLLSICGDIRWVIPDSLSTEKYVPNKKIQSAVNGGALRSFIEDKKSGRGTVEAIVPTGSQMTRIRDMDGAIESLIAPHLGEASINLLSHLDGLIVFSSWSGQVAVSNLVELGFAKKERAAKAPQIAQQIRELMRRQTEEVSGLRVVFAEELESAA